MIPYNEQPQMRSDRKPTLQKALSHRAVLTEGRVAPLLVRLTIPMIFGILSMVIYNLVDTFWVGRLGKDQLAALSFTFPVVVVISSLALGLGVGASAAVSRAIGAGERDRVRRLATDSIVLALIIVGVFAVAGSLTIEPLFRLLGADEMTLPFISQYMRIWYPGMVFVVIPMVGNNIIRATGDTRTPGIVMIVGALVNAGLDPLLIFGLGPVPALGIQGAAVATVIGRSVTLVVALVVLVRREHLIDFRSLISRASPASWREILYVGIPDAGARMVLPIGAGVVTRLLAENGPEAVAGYGVATRLEFFALAIVHALAAVMAPFVGQNLGARRLDRVREGFRDAQLFSVVIGAFFLALFAVLARPIAGIFSSDTSVTTVTVQYLRIVSIAYAFQGIYVVSLPTLNVLRRPLIAAGLGAGEMFVLIVPLALLGSRLFGLPGIFGAIAVSYAITGFVARTSVRLVIARVGGKQR